MPVPTTPALRHRLRAVCNAVNLSTPLGLAVAAAGRARLVRGPRALVFAEGYRLRFPVAGAFTVGCVVITPTSMAALEERHPGTLDHEDAHAWQWAALLGLPFLPLYLLAAGWSWLRTGDTASRNAFERRAGLVRGGYHEQPATWSGWQRVLRAVGGGGRPPGSGL